MTLKTKNVILNLSTAINAINVTLVGVLMYSYPEFRDIRQLIILTITLIVFVFSIAIEVFYKKSLTAEIILFIVFLSSISMQSIRIAEVLLRSETFMIMLLVAKVCLFFKYLALLSLLGASLFSFSFKKQKIGSWLLITVLVSFILSFFFHFNTGIIKNNMLPMVIYYKEEFIITVTISFLTAATFFKNAFDAKNNEYIYIGISSTLLTISLILYFVSLNLASGIIISTLLVAGAIIYLKSIHTIRLWS